MGSKIDGQSEEAEKAVRDIRRATRRQFSAEDKIRIVIACLRGEDSVAELCRTEALCSVPAANTVSNIGLAFIRGSEATNRTFMQLCS